MNDGFVPPDGSFASTSLHSCELALGVELSQDLEAELASPSKSTPWHYGQPLPLTPPPLVVSTLTISSKVRPQAYAFLDQAAREVNQVWNFCNATSYKAWHGRYGGTRRWLSAFDMNDLLAGCGESFKKIGIDVAQCVASEHATRRGQYKTSKLRFRKSGGGHKSLGWIPFKPNGLRFSLHDKNGKRVRLPNDPQPVVPAWPAKLKDASLTKEELKQKNATIRKAFAPVREAAEAELLAWEHRRVKQAATIKMSFMGKTIRLFNGHRLLDAYRLAKQGVGSLRSGNFAQDSLGDWYLNVVIDRVEVQLAPLKGEDSAVGLDPGQVSAMTGSDGRTLRSRRYREMESKISQAQRRGHKKQSKRYSRKAKRQRLDDRNKFCHEVINDYARVWIGNLDPVKLKKSKLKGQAKSISDSAVGAVATTLTAMGHRAGRVVEKINEAYSSRRCSNCQALLGPSGLDSCDVRVWTCSGCGSRHNRDRNSGENLLHAGELAWNAGLPADLDMLPPEPRYWRAVSPPSRVKQACKERINSLPNTPALPWLPSAGTR